MSACCGQRARISGGSPAKSQMRTMAGLAGLAVQCWILMSQSLLAAAQTVYSSANVNYGGVGINSAGDISRPGPAGSTTTPATNSDKKYLLYRVPPFEASLTFPNPGFQNHRGQTALMDIDESLDAITSRYLFDFVFRYMEGLSRQHRRPLAQRLHSLEVRGDLYEVDEKGTIMVGPNANGRQRRERKLLRSASTSASGGDFDNNPKERRTSSFIPGAKPANNDQYANLPPKYILAEFTGTATFEDYRYDPNDFNVVVGEGVNSEDDAVIDIDEATLRLMIGKALKQTNAYLQELWTATDHLVASVTAASLRMDLDLALADKIVSSGGAGSSGSGFYYGAPPKTEPSLQSGGSQPASGGALGSTSLPTPATDEGLSKKEISTISVMAFFLIALVGFIAVYMKREYHHGHGHSGPARNPRSDQDDPYSPAALRRNKNGFLEFHDDWGSDSVGEEDGVYPVGNGTPPVSSRQYVNPDNGRVMYGASYTPPETEQVQAHYAAQQRNLSKRKPRRNLALISPMMTVVEEEPPPPPPSRFSELPRSRNGHQLGSTNDSQMYANQARSMPPLSPAMNIVQNVSSFFESVTGGPSPNAGRESITSPTGVESFIPPVPFKDFPRNDGTPCVIFSDLEESSNDWELSTELRERQALTAMSVEVGMSGVRETGHSDSIHSSVELDEPIITEEGIVDFVGKLEHLMTLKARQYAERVKMEQERAERAERRRRQRSNSQSVSPPKVSVRSNSQAASVGSPPTSKHGADKDRGQLIPGGAGNMNNIQL